MSVSLRQIDLSVVCFDVSRSALMFEAKASKSKTMREITDFFSPHGYDCYTTGFEHLVKASGSCYDPGLEDKPWGNIICVSNQETHLHFLFDAFSLGNPDRLGFGAMVQSKKAWTKWTIPERDAYLRDGHFFAGSIY